MKEDDFLENIISEFAIVMSISIITFLLFRLIYAAVLTIRSKSMSDELDNQHVYEREILNILEKNESLENLNQDDFDITIQTRIVKAKMKQAEDMHKKYIKYKTDLIRDFMIFIIVSVILYTIVSILLNNNFDFSKPIVNHNIIF